jgi:hypothetical protein
VQRIARGHPARQEPRLYRHGLLQVRAPKADRPAAGSGVPAAQWALSASVRLQVLDVRRPRRVRQKPARLRMPARHRAQRNTKLPSQPCMLAAATMPNALISHVTAPAAMRVGIKPLRDPNFPPCLSPQFSALERNGARSEHDTTRPGTSAARRCTCGARVHGRLDQQRDEHGPARHAPGRVLVRRHHVRRKPGSPARDWGSRNVSPGCPPSDGMLAATRTCFPPPAAPGMGKRRHRQWAACGPWAGTSARAAHWQPATTHPGRPCRCHGGPAAWLSAALSWPMLASRVVGAQPAITRRIIG